MNENSQEFQWQIIYESPKMNQMNQQLGLGGVAVQEFLGSHMNMMEAIARLRRLDREVKYRIFVRANSEDAYQEVKSISPPNDVIENWGLRNK